METVMVPKRQHPIRNMYISEKTNNIISIKFNYACIINAINKNNILDNIIRL